MRVDVLDVALAGVERVDLARIDVEAEDGEAALAEGDRERQADVAQADDADLRSAAFDAGLALQRVCGPFDSHVRPVNVSGFKGASPAGVSSSIMVQIPIDEVRHALAGGVDGA